MVANMNSENTQGQSNISIDSVSESLNSLTVKRTMEVHLVLSWIEVLKHCHIYVSKLKRCLKHVKLLQNLK